jgi:hypothetical protein
MPQVACPVLAGQASDAATPNGVPRASRLSRLATRVETQLLTTQLDLLAPQSVVQDDAHEAHRRPGQGRDDSWVGQPAEDSHLWLSSWAGNEKAP